MAELELAVNAAQQLPEFGPVAALAILQESSKQYGCIDVYRNELLRNHRFYRTKLPAGRRIRDGRSDIEK
jgi:hypothetical protein